MIARAPIPSPTPSSAFERYLRDPSGFLHGLLDGLKDGVLHLLPLLLLGVGIVFVIFVSRRIFLRLRDARLGGGARRVRILPPPQVDPQRARLLWMGLHAILRPWWKRIVLGQPHLAWEVTSAPDELELALWIPQSVPPGLVERAVEVAFPGAKTEITDADPLERCFHAGVSSCASSPWRSRTGSPSASRTRTRSRWLSPRSAA